MTVYMYLYAVCVVQLRFVIFARSLTLSISVYNMSIIIIAKIITFRM